MSEFVSLDLEAAAKACGFSVKTLRGAIASGELIAHRRSLKATSKFVIRVADLDAWIESLPYATEKTA
jgi:hypothetical protein